MHKVPFLTLLAFCFLGCSHVLYYPDDKMYINIKTLETPPQEFQIKNKFGDKIVFWNFHSKSYPPKAVIVQFHGNAQNISAHSFSLYWMLKHDMDLVSFDYPGYGRSEGNPTPESTVETGIDVLKWTRKKYPETPIVVIGQSLGGAVGLRAIAESKKEINPCLVVVESSFTSYKEVGRSVLSQHWWTWPFQLLPYLILSDTWAATGHVNKISPTPLLVIHSQKDHVVNYSMGQSIFKEALEPKEFWTTNNGHIDTFTGNDHLLWKNRLVKKIVDACDLKN